MKLNGTRGALLSRRSIRSIAVFSAMVLLASPLFAGGGKEQKKDPASNEVVVWTYDSFVSEWGPGAQIADAFKKATGVPVRFVSQGDGGALLAKAIAEGSKADADVILGIDQNLAGKAAAAGILLAYKPAGAERIPAELVVDREFRLTPYDYGHFAIIYDSEKIAQPPKSLEDLTKAEYARKLILMDPRTSTPGLGFLAWTKAVYGDGWKDYWKRLGPSILTVSEGWDTGYGLFTSGEAPLVLSYTTSPAYHLEYDKTERYKAALFDQGHAVQIEAAGILKSSPRVKNAKLFMDFMLKSEFQAVLPLTNWMYPVVETALPASYRIAPKPAKILETRAPTDADLSEWARVVSAK
jgi:thiamine transport system substrate-binding protein